MGEGGIASTGVCGTTSRTVPHRVGEKRVWASSAKKVTTNFLIWPR
jgi:hypothetical protein